MMVGQFETPGVVLSPANNEAPTYRQEVASQCYTVRDAICDAKYSVA